MNLQLSKPIISTDVFLAPNASVIGNVEVQSSASVWYGAVVRGDTAPIELGERCSIGDRAVVRGATRVSPGATVEPGAVVDSANIGEGAVIGAGAVLAPGTVVGAGSVVRAGSFVAEGMRIGDHEVWEGSPAQKVGSVNAQERERMASVVEKIVSLASAHAVECGKTPEQIEAEKLRQELMEERSEDYNSHMGLLGREEEVAETQARLIEQDADEQRKAGAA